VRITELNLVIALDIIIWFLAGTAIIHLARTQETLPADIVAFFAGIMVILILVILLFAKEG